MPSITKFPSGSSLCAVIDVGTNTLRLLVGCINHNGELVRIYTDRSVTRLGKQLLSTGVLNSESIELSIRSLLEFKAKCDEFGVARIEAVGTSALREAKDGREFLKLVEGKTGILIRIISGDTEAEMTLKGIKAGGSRLPDSPCYVIVDVGGGSTEVVVSNDFVERISFPVGAVKLLERYINNDPPTTSEIRAVEDFLAREFEPVLKQFSNEPCVFIATGGTATTLGSIHLGMVNYDPDRIHGLRFPYSSISSIYERLVALPLNERLAIPGLELQRADIIVPGTMIIMALLRIFNAHELFISDYGLMEGVLYDSCLPM